MARFEGLLISARQILQRSNNLSHHTKPIGHCRIDMARPLCCLADQREEDLRNRPSARRDICDPIGDPQFEEDNP